MHLPKNIIDFSYLQIKKKKEKRMQEFPKENNIILHSLNSIPIWDLVFIYQNIY